MNDECQCGDYRRDHKDGTGACRHNSREFDLNHGGKNCYRFRAVSKELTWL